MNQLAPRRRQIEFRLILRAEAIGYEDIFGLMRCGILASSCGSVQLHFDGAGIPIFGFLEKLRGVALA